MVSPIEVLAKMKPVSGFGIYLDMASQVGLAYDDPLDNPIEKGVQVAARAILTFVGIRFFCTLSVPYNIGCGIAKGVFCGVHVLNHSGVQVEEDREVLDDALKHLAHAVADFCVSKFALLFTAGYVLFPEKVQAFHGKGMEWIHSTKFFKEHFSTTTLRPRTAQTTARAFPFSVGSLAENIKAALKSVGIYA
jgi:hypothetical protein